VQPKPQALQLAWELVPRQELELEQELEQEREPEMGPAPRPKVMVAQPLATPEVQRIQELALSLVMEPTVEREGPKQETEQELELVRVQL
jgi:hypothetical protein